MNVVRLELARGLGRHIRAGHPWVFRKGLEHAPRIPAGSVVDLTENGRFVALGYYPWHQPRRGDVVVYKPPDEPNVVFIKRIAALGGDRIVLCQLAGLDAIP